MKFRYQALLLAGLFCYVLPEAKVLDSLVIEGLSVNSPNMVRNSLEIREGKDLSTADIQESIKRLYSLGLFSAVDFFIITENDSAVSLRLKLQEFPVCENVEYSGNRKIKVKDFEEAVTIKRGQIVSDNFLHGIKQKLLDLYIDKGYNLAEVKPELIETKIPGNVIVKFNINEGVKVRVKSVVFKGNKEVKTARLERKFKTKESRWWRAGEFKDDTYKAHLDTLIMFYNDLGYLDASIVKDSVWLSDSRKDIFVEITVDEGKMYYVGDFFFKGNRIMDSDTLASKISLKKGKPFDKSRFEMSKYMVENTYREEGYLWVNVSDKRNFRGDTIDVVFDIAEGKSAIVRKIDVKGNSKTMEKVIRRQIDLLPGKKYKQSLMMRSRQKIYALNYFSDVKPDLIPNNDGTIDLVFEITEKDNIGQLQVGAAYRGENDFVGTFSTSIPNFRGAGQELKINLEYGKDHRDMRLGFVEPWAFDIPLSLSGELFYSRNVYNDRDTAQSTGFVIGAGRSKLKWPDDHFTLHGSYQLSYEKTYTDADTIKDANLVVLEQGLLSRASLKIERYDLDVPLFPTNGSKLTITPQIAGLGGDFMYFKGTLGYEHYFPLPLKFVMGSRSKFGLITGLGSNDVEISRYDLFRIGGVYGDGDLRGYDDYEFGGWYNSPENGLSMFTSTLELRYPVLDQQIYLGAFADVGNTWSGLSSINLGDLRTGVGFGLRINVPMLGIMGFDFAWGLDDPRGNVLDKEPNGFQFHFLMNRGF
ncbi:MAG: outer membrane protein assembly factor BamA [Fibrobacter sp.]|nr:outer membrane protein assembly factor BamA [Fibrobacter sp.]